MKTHTGSAAAKPTKNSSSSVVSTVPFFFPGDRPSPGGVYRYKVPSEEVNGLRSLGSSAAVVLVEKAMVVIEVTIRAKVANYLEELSLADTRFSWALGRRIQGEFPVVLKAGEEHWIEYFGSLRGFKTGKIFVALEDYQARRIFRLAGEEPDTFQLFLRAALTKAAIEIREFKAQKEEYERARREVG